MLDRLRAVQHSRCLGSNRDRNSGETREAAAGAARIREWPAIRLDRAASTSHPQCVDTRLDRKSTRLNSSHGYISYAVFCLKKKKTKNPINLIKKIKNTEKTAKK